ncbi:NAD(P)H-binding protein [Embleya hyalina]|uniref:NADH-flavin reductase n=1 Tax=Embleya hyalina TaxID=516124 RepID=A0A401YJ71_9ACTN|nr:NAD(P)H-binding protein [Embleya hyalina]GCD94646.1 NADH-flavin reductase [Embleya hyalina]
MRITVFGAAGGVAGRAVSEAPCRGHEVTAVVRDPARLPDPDPRAGTFRVGGDELPVDEAEHPRHRRARFTVAY